MKLHRVSVAVLFVLFLAFIIPFTGALSYETVKEDVTLQSHSITVNKLPAPNSTIDLLPGVKPILKNTISNENTGVSFSQKSIDNNLGLDAESISEHNLYVGVPFNVSTTGPWVYSNGNPVVGETLLLVYSTDRVTWYELASTKSDSTGYAYWKNVIMWQPGDYYIDDYSPKYGSYSGQPWLGHFVYLPPDLQIIKATMVSPNVLGIGAIVKYPATCPDDATTIINFTGTVDGHVIKKSISIPKSGNPGGEWGRMVSVDINGNVLPTTPLRINLADQKIPRFTKNVKFTVTGIASYKNSGKSNPSSNEGTILLPVIVIHGVTTNWFEGKIYPVVYAGLEKSLVKNGYVPDDEGYKTLWKVSEITYSSQEDTQQNVATKMTGYITQATDKTYAAKVNLIGHSLGGLIGRFVTTEYEAKRPDGPRVHKLIMIGTPNKGSTEFYKRAFSMTRAQATKLMTTTTGQPNLRQWLSPTYSGSLFEKSGDSLAEIPNPNLKLSTNILSNKFQKNGYDKPAPAGVTYFSIYNTKLATLSSVNVTPTGDTKWYIYAQPRKYGVGDKTVLVNSAQTSYAVSKPVSTTTGHGGLASDTLVIQKVLNSLKDL